MSDSAAAPVSPTKAPESAGLPPPVSASSASTTHESVWSRCRHYMMEDIDEKHNLTTIPLVGYCLMTGWMCVFSSFLSRQYANGSAVRRDVVAFSAIFVWCAFQTGNSVQVRLGSVFLLARHSRRATQLAVALARLFQGPRGHRDGSFHLADKFALTSVLTFLFGAFCGRIGDRIGPKTRLWLFGGTFFQALLTMGGAIALHEGHQRSVANVRDDLAWSNACSYAALGLISMSMGLQGIMGKRVNTQFTTTSTSRPPSFPPTRC